MLSSKNFTYSFLNTFVSFQHYAWKLYKTTVLRIKLRSNHKNRDKVKLETKIITYASHSSMQSSTYRHKRI